MLFNLFVIFFASLLIWLHGFHEGKRYERKFHDLGSVKVLKEYLKDN